LLILLLKLTKKGKVLTKNVKMESRLSSNIFKKMLKELQKEEYIIIEKGVIRIGNSNRLRLALKAASLGSDIQEISSLFSWQEFEDMTALALERNGYVVAKNVRFKYSNRRWEIDVVGCRKPLVLCIDCKHWKRGLRPSALIRVVEKQAERSYALMEALPISSLRLECAIWRRAKFIPIILSLFPSSYKFHKAVPVVPVLQFQDFLTQLPALVESLRYSTKNFHHL
jgi:hypothetical protein